MSRCVGVGVVTPLPPCHELLLPSFQRLRIALDLIDKGAEARSYCSIGNCLRASVQPEKALECYSRVRRERGDGRGERGEGDRKVMYYIQPCVAHVLVLCVAI